jgi:hypothetical protein
VRPLIPDIDRPGLHACALGALLLLAACTHPIARRDAGPAQREPARVQARPDERQPPRAERATRNERPAPGRDDDLLREGVGLFHDGRFGAAIERLDAYDRPGSPVRHRVTALKYIAFSYCVTGRPAPCRQAFARALRLDPGFDLTPGEQGHPMWGPAFARARQGGRANASAR